MVDETDVIQGITSSAGGIAEAIIWIIIIIGIGALVVLLWMMLRYKHRVRVRTVINGREIITDDKAKKWKDKDGVTWWKLRKTRIKAPSPPPEAIDINKRGKLITEAYLAEDGSFIWNKSSFDYKKYRSGDKTGFEPLTTQQRALFVNEILAAEAYKKKKLGDLLIQALPYIAVILIISVFMIFLPDIINATDGTVGAFHDAAQKLEDASNTLGNACLGRVIAGTESEQPPS